MEPRGIVKAFPKVKRSTDSLERDKPQKKVKQTDDVKGDWLAGVTIHIIQAGIGKARAEIFQKQVLQNGGCVSQALSPDVTHVIVDDRMDCDRAFRILKISTLPPGLQLVKSAWLSLCIAEKQLVSTAGYSIFIPERYLNAERQPQAEEETPGKQEESKLPESSTEVPQTELKQEVTETLEGQTSQQQQQQQQQQQAGPTKENERQCFKMQVTEDDGSDGEESGVTQSDLEALVSGRYPTGAASGSEPSSASPAVSGKWVCAQSSEAKKENHNRHITEKLEVLAKAYTHQGDKWRALGYSKAINALKSYPRPVTSYEEACKITGIGKRMADKIKEILESGRLRKLDYISESVSVLELFSNIWGAGVKTAQMWYQQGFRTLEDIHAKASLTNQQAVGLKHYEDLLDRMPREEAAEIEKTVRDMALSINPGLVAITCGSYRRGKATCGDVDVLITHPDGKSHKGVFSKVLHGLKQSGFLTDDLISHEENGNQKKYLGVCRLPEPGRRHRRLDIIVVPYSEFACALLYFTGSAHFNRSMRALAKTKRMSLSEHSLNRDVIRRGAVKVSPGVPVPTPAEKDVFEQLGLPYRDPHQRDW
ncbi:DNA polymerase lambda [Latimeria chalumnae]|uniref:DNA polymerase lambda n=1 Tax=Latimeria chalumnae TaxID=7897 RepID=UPI00313C67F9